MNRTIPADPSQPNIPYRSRSVNPELKVLCILVEAANRFFPVADTKRSPIRAGVGLVLAVALISTPIQSFAEVTVIGPGERVTVEDGGRQTSMIVTGVLGAQVVPEYFGANSQQLYPMGSVEVPFLFSQFLRYGDPVLTEDPLVFPPGFIPRLSARYVPPRDSSDYPELTGLEDVGLSIEIGAGVGYVSRNAEVFADLRYGLGGHDSFVAAIEANYIARPMDRMTVRFGPRLLFGTDKYNQTYFGITPDEAIRSQYPAYDPAGGLVSAGLELVVTHRFADTWWLEVGAKYERFQDAAAGSPIVRNGSADQFEVRVGLRRAFLVRF